MIFTFYWLLVCPWDFGCEDVGLSLKFPLFHLCLVIAWTQHIALLDFKGPAIDCRPEALDWSFQEFFGILLYDVVAWAWIWFNWERHSLGLRVEWHALLHDMLGLERRSVDFIERYCHIFFSFTFLKSFLGRSKALVFVLL